MVNITKIITSYFVGRNVIGARKSIIMGVSFCVKFSTSIVIIKFIFDKGLIDSSLYSVLIGTTLFFKFGVPLLMSYLIKRWNISPSRN